MQMKLTYTTTGEPYYVPDPDAVTSALPTEIPTYDSTDLAKNISANGTGSVAVDKLFGLGGQERYQTWPERTVRSAVSLPVDVLSGAVPDMTGLRREDFTDAPPPQGAIVNPVAAQPGDTMIERAQDMAGLAGGAPLAMKPGVASVASGMTRKMTENNLKLTAVEGSPFSYRGEHTSPSADVGSPLHDVSTNAYPKDFYGPNGLQYYAPGNSPALDASTYHKILQFKDKPDELVNIWRAIPAEKKPGYSLNSSHINPGDWVTINRNYAVEHGEGVLNGKYAIAKSRVPAKELFTQGDSFHEWGWHPTLLSDSSRAGAPLAALENAPAFYSAVEHAVNNNPQSKMSGQQWLGTIQNSKGVKPEELEWSGLADYLADKPSATKQEVQEFLQNNKIELQEVNKGENNRQEAKAKVEEAGKALKNAIGNKQIIATSPDGKEISLYGDEVARAVSNKMLPVSSLPKEYQSLAENLNNAWDAQVEAGKNATTKFQSYQLPGGENYREMLLTLPDQSPRYKPEDLKPLPENHPAFWKNANNIFQVQTPDNIYQIAKSNRPDRMIETFEDAKKYVLENKLPNLAELENFKSSHWDEPNVLAHVRMNDRVIDGKKSLHIEEIQSDLHQKGRAEGYKISDVQKQKLNTIDEKLMNGLEEKDIGNPDINAVLKTAIDKKVISASEAQNYKDWSKGENSTIPDAPFKKTWHELALKRMIREAAEKGYDRISWTPGEAQAARYDLSKHVDGLNITASKDGTYGVWGYKDGAVKFEETNLKKEQLADYMGKDIAKKALEDLQNKDQVNYKGLDLKVGGEGMKGFYDNMIPKALEKIGKEHGVKVKQGEIKTGLKDDALNTKLKDNGYDPDVNVQTILADNGGRLPRWLTENEFKIIERGENLPEHGMLDKNKGRAYEPIHYIDIPQSLKDVALRKGFPLFSGGVMLSPAEQNPFEPKLTPVPNNPFESE